MCVANTAHCRKYDFCQRSPDPKSDPKTLQNIFSLEINDFGAEILAKRTFTVKTNPCLRHDDKNYEKRYFVIFEDTPQCNHIKRELSTRPFH